MARHRKMVKTNLKIHLPFSKGDESPHCSIDWRDPRKSPRIAAQVLLSVWILESMQRGGGGWSGKCSHIVEYQRVFLFLQRTHYYLCPNERKFYERLECYLFHLSFEPILCGTLRPCLLLIPLAALCLYGCVVFALSRSVCEHSLHCFYPKAIFY